jgi:hypothetical protein
MLIGFGQGRSLQGMVCGRPGRHPSLLGLKGVFLGLFWSSEVTGCGLVFRYSLFRRSFMDGLGDVVIVHLEQALPLQVV